MEELKECCKRQISKREILPENSHRFRVNLPEVRILFSFGLIKGQPDAGRSIWTCAIEVELSVNN